MIQLIGLIVLLSHTGSDGTSTGTLPEVGIQDAEIVYARVFVQDLSDDTLETIKDRPGLLWWVQVGHEFLVRGKAESVWTLSQTLNVEFLGDGIDSADLVFVRCYGQQTLTDLPGRILARFGSIAVMDAPILKMLDQQNLFRTQNSFVIRDFAPNTVLVGPATDEKKKAAAPRADISELVAEVDAVRWFADVQTLASYDRHTLRPGIHDARDWLIAQFDALPGLDVSTQEFIVSSSLAYNVIAVLPGQTTPDDWYIVGAHYDATAGSGSPAPGADDNGSGTAAVLEMARIFSEYPTQSTVIFICYSGEEQGLVGSTAHVNELQASGDIDKVRDVIIMDMIGYSQDAVLDCLLETRTVGQALMDALEAAAVTYTDLVIHTTLFAFGSDHVPYLNQDLPAVLTIEDDWSIYPYYHTVNDLPEHLVPDMAEEIVKMNVATLADLAGLVSGSASYEEYLEAWATLPADPRFSDSNGNGVIDITEILVFLD